MPRYNLGPYRRGRRCSTASITALKYPSKCLFVTRQIFNVIEPILIMATSKLNIWRGSNRRSPAFQRDDVTMGEFPVICVYLLTKNVKRYKFV